MNTPSHRTRLDTRWLREYSLPLLVGVATAVTMANWNPDVYRWLVETPLPQLAWGSAGTAGETGGHMAHAAATLAAHHDGPHFLTLHFLVNDIFMVFFFGVAAKEITEACLPGGALNPPAKALNPLCATLGGVIGPIAVFWGLNHWIGDPSWARGWGIPTATDIALAWLVARFVFGKGHPAVSFLLLLAVADDAIGLGIIALAYPDPLQPTEWWNAAWILPGMGCAWLLRRLRVRSWLPYVLLGGSFSWVGLHTAHLHPALALVFIVPFMPGPRRDWGLFRDAPGSGSADAVAGHAVAGQSPLEQFEHSLRAFVDYGLFFFAFANAGVSFAAVNQLTWIVLGALILGKTLGVASFSYLADRCGLTLPSGMRLPHLMVTGIIAGVGLTVALFVSGQAYQDGAVQGAAKMGALFSVVGAVLAYLAARWLGVRPAHPALPGGLVADLLQPVVGPGPVEIVHHAGRGIPTAPPVRRGGVSGDR